MEQKLQATIEMDADFSKADKELKKYIDGLERKSVLKPSTVQKYTQPFLQKYLGKWSNSLAFQKGFLKSGTSQERMRGYLTAMAKKGFFGDIYKSLGSKEEKSKYVDSLVKGFNAFISKNLSEEEAERKKQKIQLKRDQEERARKEEGERKWNIRMNLLHDEALKENKKFDERLKKQELKAQKDKVIEEERNRKKLFNALLLKWGKLGLWGQAIQFGIRGVTAGARMINNTAQTALGFSRTIEGGASEGSFFGRSLAAYQRAGISAQTYGSWKRNMQGQVGALKLGMGNAAPFMMLGVSALDKMDDIELEIEKRLQKLPAETSWALGSQLGLSYELWEAMYKGKIDRSKPGYDEDAIKAWTEAANNINSLITDIKTLFFNNLAPVVRMMTTKQGLTELTTSGFTGGLSNWANPFQLVGRGALDLSMRITRDGDVIVDENALTAQNVNTSIQIN